jgi:cytochrome P450
MTDAPFAYDALTYDPFACATQENPYPVYRYLLRECPIYYNPERDFWALARFHDVKSAFQDWRTFSSAAGVTVDELLALTGPGFLTMDPPRHDQLRDIVRRFFEPRRVAVLASRIEETVTALLSPLEGRREVDVADELAKKLPVLVICELMGLPPEDHVQLKIWSDAILERSPGDDATPPAARSAAAALRAYLIEQIERHRISQLDDVLGALVSAHDHAGLLTFEELIGTSMLIFEAGNSTTTSLIANGLLVLAGHPVQRAWLAAHPEGVARSVEELLRYESPVQNMGRTTNRRVDVHGVEIPAGARVLLLIGAANRDPRVWDQPDELVLWREPKRGAVFGEGIHHCIGAGLARLEMSIVLTRFLQRFPDYDVQEFERFHDVTQRGLKRLVVRLAGVPKPLPVV